MPDAVNETAAASEIFEEVSVSVRVCVGIARPTLQELVALDTDAVLPLDRSISDEVELYVGERLLAHGVLEEAEGEAVGQLQVRITSLGSPK